MTVLDQVLQAEALAATTVAQATAAAAQHIATAKTAQTETVASTKNKLAEQSGSALAAHRQTVEKQAESIAATAEGEVSAIKSAFAAKSADLTKKINDALA